MSSMSAVEGSQARFPRHGSARGKSVSTLPATKGGLGGITGHDGQDEHSQQREAATGNPIAQSLSRYRRRANSVSGHGSASSKINSDPPPKYGAAQLPPVPAIPRALKGNRVAHDDGPHPSPHFPPDSPPRATLRHTDTRQQRKGLRQCMVDDQSRPATATDHSQQRRMADLGGRRAWLGDPDDDAQHAGEAAQAEAERDRLLIEQKRKDLQRLEAQLADSSHKASAQSHKPKSPIVEKFVLLTKGRKNKDGASPNSSTHSVDKVRSPTLLQEPAKAVPAFIEPGGKGIVPQTDAPISAINAGDRNVTVRCRHHTFSLEVTPDTTPDDILLETSDKMSYDLEITPENCVVIEQYGLLGLERPLRRYERIRDVMNSWDRDTQNQLVVTISESNDADTALGADAISKNAEAPPGFQLYMYHSNRPGKWNKRWVTLLETGQMLCSKKPNASSADKDTAGLCRLSDYDIYTPTESQMRRHIKPPKRHCFAVKSQQKTTVFMNTENYVQYFSTDDAKLAAQFQERVQGWRSWYLVDRNPEPKKKQRKASIPKAEEKAPQIAPTKHVPKKSINVAALDGHRLRVSIDEAPYSIGQFEPLLDMKRFDKRLSQFGKDFLPPVPPASTMPKLNPQPAPDQAAADGKLVDIKSAKNDAFTGGLLGEGYEERKQLQAVTDRKSRSTDAAFTQGPSLLNRQAEQPQPETPTDKPESPSWFPSALEHSARHRPVGNSVPARPSTSSGVMHTRRPSLSSSSRPPLPTVRGDRRPSTQHSNSSSLQSHPNPLASQPTGMSQSQSAHRRAPPKPLININGSPVSQTPPRDGRDKNIGHGVKVPESMTHLVDLISVGTGPLSPSQPSGLLAVPPRSALRGAGGRGNDAGAERVPRTVPLPPKSALSRTRSKSSGAPPSRPLIDDIPPVPSVLRPGMGRVASGDKASLAKSREFKTGSQERRDISSGSREEKDREVRGRERETARRRTESKARDRARAAVAETREKEAAHSAAAGRTGTLKVV
ncbi:hypothetical protein GGR56DRAFT_106332 [Xylariaceae sp. FL0804]|nr:hypothetical protein GGR56DRAFT_106332 [Xylariaceae sp. FL0804]